MYLADCWAGYCKREVLGSCSLKEDGRSIDVLYLRFVSVGDSSSIWGEFSALGFWASGEWAGFGVFSEARDWKN